MNYKWQPSNTPNVFAFRARYVCYDETGKVVGEVFGDELWHAALHRKKYLGEYINIKKAQEAVIAALQV